MYNSSYSKVIDNNCEVFYTPKDIMRILKISQWKAYQLFSAKGFPAIKIGGSLRIEKNKFVEWCNQYAGESFPI